MFTIEFDHLDGLSQFYSQWRQTSKLVNFQDFCWGLGMRFSSNIWKWLKLLYSVQFIKKTFLNHVYNLIWSFWLTVTVLQWRKTNFKISQFSRFLLRPRYAIFGQNLKMAKTSLFCSNHQEKTYKSCLQSNLTILNDFHSSTVNEDKLQN